jgi:hypothetical protein
MAKGPAHGRTARLGALIARARRMGVIFRRGPSGHVRLIRWNLTKDTFLPGQWLKARVYELRCDLSPDGELLCYFAATHRAPFPTYTAISRPPFFTALALWGKGDCWGGGGLFDSSLRLRLNHRPEPYRPNTDEMILGEGFRLPNRFTVMPLWENAGWGEDDPIRTMRMERDGWSWTQRGHRIWQPEDAPVRLLADVPEIMVKPVYAAKRVLYTLRITCHGHFERDGRASLETAEIVGLDNAVLRNIERIDWTDLDHNGDVLWAWAGKLWRLARPRRVTDFATAEPRMLADFNDMRFEPVEAPPRAQRW